MADGYHFAKVKSQYLINVSTDRREIWLDERPVAGGSSELYYVSPHTTLT